MNGLVLEDDSNRKTEDVKEIIIQILVLEDGTADNGAEPIKDEDGNITGYEKLFTQDKKLNQLNICTLHESN